MGGKIKTFPRSVIAANRVDSGSAVDWSIPIMVPHESFYIMYVSNVH